MSRLLLLLEMPAIAPRKPTADDLFACPTGTALWETYRTLHPKGSTNPQVLPEDVPAPPVELETYWNHVDGCGNYLEL